MALIDDLRRQFDDGSVWYDRDTMHPHDDVVRKLRTESGFKDALLRELPTLLESDRPRHLTGVVALLFEVARDVGAETLTRWAQGAAAKVRCVKPSWPCGVESLDEGFVDAVAMAVKPTDVRAIAWLKDLAPSREYRLKVLPALARVAPDFVVEHARDLVSHDHLAVLEALPHEKRLQVIEQLAPWPPARITPLTRAFWKRIPVEEGRAMRRHMWPNTPFWPFISVDYVNRLVMPRVGLIGVPLSGRMSLLDAYHRLSSETDKLMTPTTAGAVTLCRANVPALNPKGLKTRLHLFSLPSPGFQATPMQVEELLAGVDAVGFVVPSDPARWDEWRAFRKKTQLGGLPHLFLATLRDRADAATMEHLERELQLANVRECNSKVGTGVREAIDALGALAMERLRTA